MLEWKSNKNVTTGSRQSFLEDGTSKDGRMIMKNMINTLRVCCRAIDRWFGFDKVEIKSQWAIGILIFAFTLGWVLYAIANELSKH